MKECHDSKWAGHPSIHHTLTLVGDSYYWPHLKEHAKAYVKTCIVFQQDKVEQGALVGLLEPVPIAKRPWESISIDSLWAYPQLRGATGYLSWWIDTLSMPPSFPQTKNAPLSKPPIYSSNMWSSVGAYLSPY